MGSGRKILYLFIILGIGYLLWKHSLKEQWNNTVCKIEPPPEHERVTAEVVKHYRPRIAPKTSQKIPRIIIQTNEKSTVPVDMLKSMNDLINLNPEYEYLYFDNDDVVKYLTDNFEPRIIKAYNKLKPGAYKADLFRYCILYKMGGVYIDSPMTAKAPLSTLIRSNDEFISPEDNQTNGIYNAFICSVSGHSIMKKCIADAISNIEREFYGSGDLTVTGPQLLSRVFEDIVGKKVEPDKDYGKGIRLITHYAVSKTLLCPSVTIGHLLDGEKEIFTTRYPSYYVDRLWYNTNKHYSKMWKDGDIFRNGTLKEHQETLMDLMEKFIDFADKYNLSWWSTGGTLLGAIREQDIIKWDDDIDIEVPTKVVNFLKSKQKELNAQGLKFEMEDHIWRFRYLEKNKAYIDVFEVKRDGDKWTYVDDYNTERWPKSYFTHDELFPLTSYKFGNLQVKGAKNPFPYLERQYQQWKTPVKDPTHHKFD